MLVIDRNCFFRDSFEQFRTTTDFDLRGDLSIHFLDELAEDAGGLAREWFSLITEEIFNPDRGLFKRSNTKELTYIIDPTSKDNPLMKEYFEFAGKVIAKAIFERVPIKSYFNKIILNQILDKTLTIEDLKNFDEELWNSIEYVRNTPMKDGKALGLTFTVENGNVELKKKGKEISVLNLSCSL